MGIRKDRAPGTGSIALTGIGWGAILSVSAFMANAVESRAVPIRRFIKESTMEYLPPFIVNAPELIAEPKDYEVDVDPSELDLDDAGVVFTGRLTGRLSWRWLDGNVACMGQLTGAWASECVRCLTPVKGTVTVPIRLVFSNEAPAGPTDFDFDPEDDSGLAPYHGDRVDAREEIRAELLIQVPDLPHCSEDCKGLCPQCRKNLNEGDCACRKAEADQPPTYQNPSWAGQLESLKKNLPE